MNFKSIALFGAVFGLGALVATFVPVVFNHFQGHHDYAHQMQKHHGVSGHDQTGHRHDEINMPGLQGKDTTQDEINDLKAIFRDHKKITRTVEPIANGIRTITETADETLREAVVNHVVGMVARLEENRNPEIIIQSPTLNTLFEGSRSITTEITATALGVEVVQTSTDPKIVKALQVHAAEVSDMTARGMRSVHERMSRHGARH